jgi:hypothetical protein
MDVDQTTEKPKEEKEDMLRERLEDLVKVTILVWSAALLTFSYVRLPDGKRLLEFDPTFIASVFSGAMASFGLATAKNAKNNNNSQASTTQPPVKSAIEPKK